MDLKTIARVGKSFLRIAVGVQENYKITKEVKYLNEFACIGCSFHGASSEYIDKYCNEVCNKRNRTIKRTIYYNEGNRYHLPKKERLSKFQLKQALVYHFLVDNNGIGKNISLDSLAELLGCSKKTIQNNNKRLIELNYIIYSESNPGHFNIIIVDYKSYHLTAREGGTGYINMSKSLLLALLNSDSVNSMRLEIRNLISFDDENINKKEIKPSSYEYKSIKRFIPRYLGYKSAIDKLLKDSSIFNYNSDNKKVEFKLKSELDSRLLRDNIEKECKELFVEYIDRARLNNKDLEDIYQMSIQYGTEKVKSALDLIIEEYVDKEILVVNMGGLIRNKIRYFVA